MAIPNILGPVVPDIISLMKLLADNSLCFSVFTKLIALILFAEKLFEAFAMQKLPTFFRQKTAVFLCIKCLKIYPLVN